MYLSQNTGFLVLANSKILFKGKCLLIIGWRWQDYNCSYKTNEITGGNSGSPVINGNGKLIGIAFIVQRKAVSSNNTFETGLQRTINVDIRYVLFIIEKYAGVKNLIDELMLVKSMSISCRLKP